MKSFRSICVLGPERSGRGSICSEIGKLLIHQPQSCPPRYLIDSERFPQLRGYVFTIYSDLSELKLDMPEREGLLVLKPQHIESLINTPLNNTNSVFLELLENVSWLGVRNYVLVVTHMDRRVSPNIGEWFAGITSRFIERLEKSCDIKVLTCIPLGKKGTNKAYANLHKRERIDFLEWHEGACLTEALGDLVSSDNEGPQSLWAIGRSRLNTTTGILNLQVEQMRSGNWENDSIVRLYPGGHQGSLVSSSSDDSHDLCLLIKLKNPSSLDQTARRLLLVAEKATALEEHTFDARVLLNSDISNKPSFLLHPHAELTLFGPQRAEGTVIARADYALEKDSPTRSGQTSSIQGQKENGISRGDFGRMVDLSIRTNSRVLIDLHNQDPDAGRVLLWRNRQDRTHFLLGTGRIISRGEDHEFKYLVDYLANLDKMCRNSAEEQSLFLSELCSIYHPALGMVSRLNKSAQANSMERSSIEQGFDRLSAKAEYVLKSHKDTLSPDKLRQLVNDEKGHILGALDLSGRIGADFDKEKEPVLGLLTKKLVLVRSRMSQPVRQSIMVAIESSRQALGVPIRHYTNLPRGSNYHSRYDVTENCYSSFSKAVHELVTNSRNHALPTEPLRIDIFIDPPKMSEIPSIKIWFQDNGILTEKKAETIQSSERGLKEHVGLLERYGVILSLCKQFMGLGTTFSMKIPVWYEKIPPLRALLLEIAGLLNSAELQRYESKRGSDRDLVALVINGLRNCKISTSILGGMVSTLENVMTDWGCEEQLEKCKRVFDALNRLTIKMGFDSIRKEFDSVEALIAKLQGNPLGYLIAEAHRKIGKEIKNRIFVLSNGEGEPAYRLKEYQNYFLIRNAITWAFEELMCYDAGRGGDSCIKISIDLPRTKGCGSINISGLRISAWEAKILPFRTRLAVLNVKSEIEEKEGGVLRIIMPIWRKECDEKRE